MAGAGAAGAPGQQGTAACPAEPLSAPGQERGGTRKERKRHDSCSSTAGADGQLQNWKLKAEQAKKLEFIRTAEKLKTQLANAEKDTNGRLYNRKSDLRVEYSILEELEHSMTISRKTEKDKVLQQLSKIQSNVRRLQQQLKDVKPTPEFVDKLKETMEEIESAISAFKEEQRQIYEQLLKEEKAAMSELSALERKVELWVLGSSTAEKVLKLPSVNKTLEKHLPEEVVEFERFLQQTGGRQGGWDDHDHHTFLKVWTKHKGRLSYMDEALEYLSGRTKEDIEQHDKWYQEFLILHEGKKKAIKKWKEKQQQEKERNLKEKEKLEKMFKEEWLQHEEAHKRKAEEERQRQRAAIEAWKKQKALTLAMEQVSQLKLEEKAKKQQKEHQRHCHTKLLLEKYSLQKKEKEKLEKLEKPKREEAEKEEMKRIAAEEITKFQERDLHKLELNILQKQAKEAEKREKEKRLAKLRQKVESQVSRDPSRLYSPTKGWEECMKQIVQSASEPLFCIPHRAVPIWGEGL
ncbi:coiled-coil domain-containing protein 112 isoform X3 [Cuculus canorus]|uniref:coiled-coil domain-containing protein 112 isoform X3 n=1 Tax=Cuculus canorus TaxID=55661 RepID=UPI0023AA2B4E|nr:coiled-coil domain-containing protein 112 isoform X3 [Cuculus canorus]